MLDVTCSRKMIDLITVFKSPRYILGKLVRKLHVGTVRYGLGMEPVAQMWRAVLSDVGTLCVRDGLIIRLSDQIIELN